MELNICLIGCGMIGKEHIERIQNRIRGAKVVAVCDVFEEGVKKGAELAGPGTKTSPAFHEAIMRLPTIFLKCSLCVLSIIPLSKTFFRPWW